MTRRVIRTMRDDLNPSLEAAETVSFGLDGQAYVIDLTAEHALELRQSLRLFVHHGRRTVGRAVPLSNTVSAQALQAKAHDNRVRAWARTMGLPVNEHGPISTDVWIKFQEAGA